MSLISRVSRSDSLTTSVEELAALVRRQIGHVAQDLRERADRGQRRAQLVADRGDEVVLEPVELLQPRVGVRAARPWPLPARATAARGGGWLDELRGLVEDVHDLVRPDDLAAATEATITRADAAPMARASWRSASSTSAASARSSSAGRSPRRRGVGRQRRVGARRTEEAGEQLPEIADLGIAAPRPGRGLAPEDVDEQHRLEALDVALARRAGCPAPGPRCWRPSSTAKRGSPGAGPRGRTAPAAAAAPGRPARSARCRPSGPASVGSSSV